MTTNPFQTRFELRWPNGATRAFESAADRRGYIAQGEQRGDFTVCAYSDEDEVVEVAR